MILPAAAITFQQGWRGAAVGAVMSNLGIGLTISSTGLLGNYDSYAYLVQEILAITATVLLALGVAITRHYRKAVASGQAVQEALGLARLSFSTSERHLRDQALRIADIQEQIEQSRSAIIRSLREHRHHAAVMEVMRSGVVQSRLFDSHINAVYPIGIESDGLYKTLGSPTLSEMWGRGIEVRRSLRGSPQGLSVELQLVAYRCICDAVAILTEGNPERVSVRAKTSVNLHGARIAICIEAINPEQRPSSESSRLAGVDLDSRVRAHGGTLHQSGDRISLMLREQPATDRYGAAFRTSQVMPLAST